MTIDEMALEFERRVPTQSVLGREWQQVAKLVSKNPKSVETFLTTMLTALHKADQRGPDWLDSEAALVEWSAEAQRRLQLERYTRDDEMKMWARFAADRLAAIIPDGISSYEPVDPELCKRFDEFQKEFDASLKLWAESDKPWDRSPGMASMLALLAAAWEVRALKA